MSDLAWLDEIERRAEAATPGPWEWEEVWREENGRALCDVFGPERRGGEWFGEHDARFIAEARSDVPKLCRAVRELYGALDRLVNAVQAVDDASWAEDVANEVEDVLRRWQHGGA